MPGGADLVGEAGGRASARRSSPEREIERFLSSSPDRRVCLRMMMDDRGERDDGRESSSFGQL